MVILRSSSKSEVTQIRSAEKGSEARGQMLKRMTPFDNVILRGKLPRLPLPLGGRDQDPPPPSLPPSPPTPPPAVLLSDTNQEHVEQFRSKC